MIDDITTTAQMDLTGLYVDQKGNWVKHNRVTGKITPLLLTDSFYFCDQSFTLSYSYDLQAFVSFHSYFPTYFYNDESYYYTVINNKIYQHQLETPYLKFNNSLYPFIIEIVDNAYQTSNLFNVGFIANFARYDSATKKYVINPNISYNYGIVYNSFQSTGKQRLSLLDRDWETYIK